MHALTLAVTELALIDWLGALNKTNPELLPLQRKWETGPTTLPHFSFQENFFSFRNRRVVPRDTKLRTLLLEEFHSSKTGGHAGISHTFHRLFSNFYLDTMQTNVKFFINTCQNLPPNEGLKFETCWTAFPFANSKGYLRRYFNGFHYWFASFPWSHGYFGRCGSFYKYGHFIALPTNFTSHKVAEVFV